MLSEIKVKFTRKDITILYEYTPNEKVKIFKAKILKATGGN